MSSKKTLFIFAFILIIFAVGIYAGYSFFNKPAEEYYMLDPGDYFVTNIKDSKCLLKSDVIIKMKDKKKFEYYSENNYLIRDEIISVLGSKKLDELGKDDSQNILKSEIIAKLNQFFEDNLVADVYFNDFVIQ